MKIRSLAASALVGLIYPFNICDQISNTLANIDEMSPENSVHGCLLQVWTLIFNDQDISMKHLIELISRINQSFLVIEVVKILAKFSQKMKHKL